MMEREIKYTLASLKDLEILAERMGAASSDARFVNIFLDTPLDELAKKGRTLRLRTDRLSFFEITMKSRLSGSKPAIRGPLFQHNEINVIIGRPLYELIVSEKSSVGDLPEDIQSGLDCDRLSHLRCLGHFECRRRRYDYAAGRPHGCPFIELDHVKYHDGTELFELECEGETPENIREDIIGIMQKAGVRYRESRVSKFGIFRLILDRE